MELQGLARTSNGLAMDQQWTSKYQQVLANRLARTSNGLASASAHKDSQGLAAICMGFKRLLHSVAAICTGFKQHHLKTHTNNSTSLDESLKTHAYYNNKTARGSQWTSNGPARASNGPASASVHKDSQGLAAICMGFKRLLQSVAAIYTGFQVVPLKTHANTN